MTTETRTTSMTAAQKRAIRELYGKENVTFHADGSVTLRQGFYYRMSKTVDKLKKAVLAVFPTAEIDDAGERYANWPSDSYLWVKFRLSADNETK